MVKVAQMLYMLSMGGVENFLMNMYRNIDREKYQFDFILQVDEEGYFEKEIESLGGKIYRIPRFEKHPIKHIKELKKILKNGNYQAIHRHTANSVVFYDLLIAKLCGIKIRVSHSHSTTHAQKILNYICRPFLLMFANRRIACGNNAGKWLYGNGKFKVLNNGIDTKRFLYTDKVREEYRNELNLNGKIVLGHVGRFEKEKNHRYLIEIFEKLCSKSDKYVLLLCGDGSLKAEMEQLCKDKGILEKVKFLGARKDVNNILQAMDIFVFPSLYEGLSITLIEAQMSNIPIMMADTIAKETIYNNNVEMIGIKEEDIDIWCEKIEKCELDIKNRVNLNKQILKDYDVKNVLKELTNMYKGE